VAEEVPAAKALFDKASEILGYDLLDRAVNGPKDVLDSTVCTIMRCRCCTDRLADGWTEGSIGGCWIAMMHIHSHPPSHRP